MALPDPSDLPARLRALPAARPVLDALADAGSEAAAEVYLVGGAVRDLWLGGAPLDLDLVVVGEVAPLATRLGAAVAPHERFGTATVEGAAGARYDLAQARRERYPAPGALPIVEPASIDEDLARRDFTVNAFALGLSGPRSGTLLELAHGREDLAVGHLRVLHDGSFRDDPTRLLRLARYAGRLGFTAEERTADLARAAVEEGALTTVSGPRLGAELVLLGGERDPVAAFGVLCECGIDTAIAPGFGLGAPGAGAGGAIDGAGASADEGGAGTAGGGGGGLANRALALLPADGDRVALLLGLATQGVSDFSMRHGVIAHLGLPAARRDAALAVASVTDIDGLADRLAAADRPSQIDAAIGRAPVEAVAAAAALERPGSAGARRWLQIERFTTIGISGADLVAAGIAPGPAIATGLRAARAALLDGRAGDRAAQLEEALRAAGAAG